MLDAVEMRLIEPSNAAVYKIGVPLDITWGYKGTMTQVDIILCRDYPTCSSTVVIANDVTSGQGASCTAPSGGTLQANETGGCYHWADGTTGGVSDHRGFTNRIQIVDADAATVPPGGTRPSSSDYSDNNFKIVPNIILTTPNSALKWDSNTANTIQFQIQGSGMNNVDILFSDDSGGDYGGTVIMGKDLSADAPDGTLKSYSHSWTTPLVISNTTDPVHYRVKIEDPNGTDYNEAEIASSIDFDIVAKFAYTAPTAPDNWFVGDNKSLFFSC